MEYDFLDFLHDMTKVYTRQQASEMSWYTMPNIENWIKQWKLDGMYYQEIQWPKHKITYISQEWVDKLKSVREKWWLRRGRASYKHKKVMKETMENVKARAEKALSK